MAELSLLVLREQEQGGEWPEGWIHLALHGCISLWRSDGERPQETPGGPKQGGDGNCSPFLGRSWASHGCHGQAQLAPPKSHQHMAKPAPSLRRQHPQAQHSPPLHHREASRNSKEGERKKNVKNKFKIQHCYILSSASPQNPWQIDIHYGPAAIRGAGRREGKEMNAGVRRENS